MCSRVAPIEKGEGVTKRRLIALLVGALMALILGAPAALAGGTGGGTDGKCNSGSGNMSETAPPPIVIGATRVPTTRAATRPTRP